MIFCQEQEYLMLNVFEASSKTFFISGAGGSIGAEITRQLTCS
jgi:FlaA1/EpsC-like NDP-sugar epimerase